MAVKVVDASALGALLFGEPEADAVAATLSEAELIAPSLLPYEIASICLKKLRKHGTQRESLLAAFDLFGRLPVAIVEVAHAGILELAEQSGLSSYDASYLWLARNRDAELITLDQRLAAAMRASSPASSR